MFLSMELFGMLENCKQRDILALVCLCTNHIKYDEHYFDLQKERKNI